MRVIIVGGGIGGIATALALRAQGVEFVVLEQARELRSVGAGIQLSPNGVKVLHGLGLGEAIAEFAVEPGTHRFQEWQTAELVLELPLCPETQERFGVPYLHAHRADLLSALVRALLGSSEQESVASESGLCLGVRVQRVEQDGSVVRAICTDGSADDPSGAKDGMIVEGDALIAADGVHSRIRDQLFDPGTPKDWGYAAWRGLVPADEAESLGIERHSYIWMGPERSMVLYQVSAGRLVNWVGIGPSPAAVRESWSAQGSTEEALRDYQGWHPQVLGLIERTEAPFITKLLDREPLESWVEGRVALLGDAAHAMLPYHAQGAVQSLEDAWVVAHCLAEAEPGGQYPTIESALARYQELRRDRTTQVQAYSRAAQDWYHYTEPRDIERRNERFRRVGRDKRGGFSRQQEWLYAYDAEKAARGEDEEWRRMSWR